MEKHESPQNPSHEPTREPRIGEEQEIEEEEEDEDEDDEIEDNEAAGEDYEALNPNASHRTKPRHLSQEEQLRLHKSRLVNLSRRLQSEELPLRVHDVLIKGNTKTKDWVIEAELEELRNAKSLQELLKAASVANFQLQQLGIFHSVNIVLDSGPKELPGTANVVVNVVEASNPISGEIGYYTKPEVKFLFIEIRQMI